MPWSRPRTACITKVILETSLLDDEQIARGSRLTEAGGADFVKTSTGFAGGGATVPHVELMRASVGPDVQVKASGGVRGLDTALEMLGAGATRLGTSASATILGELRARLSGGGHHFRDRRLVVLTPALRPDPGAVVPAHAPDRRSRAQPRRCASELAGAASRISRVTLHVVRHLHLERFDSVERDIPRRRATNCTSTMCP